MKKIKIHIRNNHWKEGFLPCDAEGEKNNTITKEEIEKGFDQYPELRDKVEYVIDWDDDNLSLQCNQLTFYLAGSFQHKI